MDITEAQDLRKLTLRSPFLEDAAAISDVLNACSIADTGTPDSTPEDILNGWREPGRNYETDDLVAVESDGRIVGAISVLPRARNGITIIDGYVHPSCTGRGIGSQLLAWAEHRALRDDEEATVSHGVIAATAGLRLLEVRGYTRARSFHHMTGDVPPNPAQPSWPNGVVICTFPESGLPLRPVYEAVLEAFDDHWGGLGEDFDRFAYRISDGSADPDMSLWFVAMDGEAVAGTIFASTHNPHDPSSAWIRYVAVRAPWRGRGLARAMLQHVYAEIARRGIRKASLGVDSENLTGATRLYERAGMRVTLRIDAMQKRLRR